MFQPLIVNRTNWPPCAKVIERRPHSLFCGSAVQSDRHDRDGEAAPVVEARFIVNEEQHGMTELFVGRGNLDGSVPVERQKDRETECLTFLLSDRL